MKNESITEARNGLPKLEGVALMAIRNGTEVQNKDKNGKDYVTHRITAFVQFDEGGTKHLGLHDFNKMGPDGKLLAGSVGKVMAVSLKRSAKGFTELSVIGDIDDIIMSAKELRAML